MSYTHVSTRKNRAQIRKIINSIPKRLKGQGRDPEDYAATFWGTVAHSLFTDIYEAFLIKSDGGTDELGIRWKDLTRREKAYGFSDRGDLTRNQRKKRNDKSTPGLLTPGQYEKWKSKYHEVVMKHKKRLGEEEAKKYAAKVAWTVVKDEGGETLLDVLGDRDIAIMRGTDRLLNSYKPGRLTTRKYTPRKDQLFEFDDDGLTIGSKVEYADQANKERTIIPDNLGPWLDRAIDKGTEALAEAIARDIR